MTETTRVKRLFRDAIRRGTGRAHLLMGAHPGVNFSADILKAASINYAYDPQSEGSRGEYLVRLILLSSQRELLIRQVLAQLLARREEWGLTQLFDIARRLAEAGYPAAREALYQRFQLGSTLEYIYLGDYELVELDGIAGLLRVATVRGQMLALDSEDYEDDSLFCFTQERNPNVAVEAELEKAAATNPSVALYLQALRDNRELSSQEPPRQRLSARESIRRFITTSKTRRVPPHTVRLLTARQIRLLAAEFAQETSRRQQAKYLSIFRLVKYPLGPDLLLQLVEAPPRSPYGRALDDSVKALRFFSSPTIREFALAKLANSLRPWRYASLLINNYEAGDDQLLLRLVEQTNGEHAIESLAISLCAIYQKNRTKKCLEPLRALYQRMNCGMHRADVVELLLRRGVLPADIREEIPFDSYEGVRDLVPELPTPK